MEHDVDLSELQGPEAVEAQMLISSMISELPERRISSLQVSRTVHFHSLLFADADLSNYRFFATLFSGDRTFA